MEIMVEESALTAPLAAFAKLLLEPCSMLFRVDGKRSSK
jgi:hypothetical protein